MYNNITKQFICECGRIILLDKKETQKCPNCGKPTNKEELKQILENITKEKYEEKKVSIHKGKKYYRIPLEEYLNKSYTTLINEYDWSGSEWEDWFLKYLYVNILCACCDEKVSWKVAADILRSTSLERFMFYNIIFNKNYIYFGTDLPPDYNPFFVPYTRMEGFALSELSFHTIRFIFWICCWNFRYISKPKWKYVQEFNRNVELDKQGKLGLLGAMNNFRLFVKGNRWDK